MSGIIESLTDPTLRMAIEDNFTEEMACFGRSVPGAQLHEDQELTWVAIAPTGINVVLRTHFSASDSASIDRRIEETLTHFRNQQAQGLSWRVGPNPTPANLAPILESHGFKHRATQDCMLLHIPTIKLNQPQTDGLSIKEVTNLETLKLKCSIEQLGFEASDAIAQDYYLTYQRSGFGPAAQLHHYIGSMHGKAVAVSAHLLHHGIAGIYGVTTLPEARRQGIARAMTLHAVQAASKLGYRIATLSPNPMSHAIYQQIGFTDYCQFHHYRYTFI